MNCNNCGGVVEMDKDQTDNTTAQGEQFTEVYSCIGCGQTGTISGVVGQPVSRWNKTGVVSQ